MARISHSINDMVSNGELVFILSSIETWILKISHSSEKEFVLINIAQALK